MYIVYKTTNIINNKIYIGVHKTNNINDAYLGSGEVLFKAINKYGSENFIREIIDIFKSKKSAYSLERKIVNKNFILRTDNYNIRIGGEGGDGGPEVNKKISDTLMGRKRSYFRTPDMEAKRVRTIYSRYGKDAFCTFSDKHHKEESKRKQSKNMKGRSLGNNNSQYGTCWIYSQEEKISKKIKKEDLKIWLKLDWIKGRRIKF